MGRNGHPPIQRNCLCCGKEFTLKFSWRNRVFCCSSKCAGVLRRKPAIQQKCLHCKKHFVSVKNHRHKQTFCSRKCVWDHGNIEKTCPICSKAFRLRKSMVKSRDAPNRKWGVYCSNKCRIIAWGEERKKKQAPGSYRKNGWEGREKQCASCGYKKHLEIIVIHHIDGNRENGAISNLIPLCPTCHAEAHPAMGENCVPSARKVGSKIDKSEI